MGRSGAKSDHLAASLQGLDPLTADRRLSRRDHDESMIVSLDTYCRANLLIDALLAAMARFEAATQARHTTDPENFPLVRSERAWWQEFRAFLNYEAMLSEHGLVEADVAGLLES